MIQGFEVITPSKKIDPDDTGFLSRVGAPCPGSKTRIHPIFSAVYQD
jgi:hypothetical protein